ncbi:hypothetical protein [Desulfohalovibrio reitneri]|uniref:hypothetical protein n=1 Tax=Desulfohalovibrio reitneri TaxID=1307759 RepID=UPI0004A6CF25|nr:hypothetical protein [Desulfohalovibrio reitneri]
MVNPIESGYAAQAVSATNSASQKPKVQQTNGQGGDTVSLSRESLSMTSFFQGLGVEHTPGKSVTLKDLRAGLERTEEAFRGDVGALFIENGIRAKPPVELTTARDGSVVVKGDHPQKEKIEQLFEDNPDLSNDFRKVACLTSMIEAGQEHMEFARAYRQDPYAAVAEYGHLFNSMPADPFSLTIGEERTA